MKKRQFSSVIYFAIIIGVIILSIRHFHIPDFCHIVPETLYTSGQPRGMDYTRLLYKYQISTIVNVRSASEHREKNWHNEELSWTKENAVKYIELPIGKQDYFPNNQVHGEFLSLMNNRENLPVLLHGSGDDKRVAVLTAIWLRKGQGVSVEETIRQIKKIIDDRPLTEQEIDFVTNLK
jgi:protein tyrosine/serine phosphatase